MGGSSNVNVWGSGFIQDTHPTVGLDMHYHAVRGKLSANKLDVDTALGDPGLLVPLFIKPAKHKKYKLGIVPHYVDQDSPKIQPILNNKNTLLINVLDTPQKVIEQITSCELIFSSSLHGLIVILYGIPNYWTPLSRKLTGGSFKFEDYYSIYNECLPRLNLNKPIIDNLDNIANDYESKKNIINKVQKKLVCSFRTSLLMFTIYLKLLISHDLNAIFL